MHFEPRTEYKKLLTDALTTDAHQTAQLGPSASDQGQDTLHLLPVRTDRYIIEIYVIVHTGRYTVQLQQRNSDGLEFINIHSDNSILKVLVLK